MMKKLRMTAACLILTTLVHAQARVYLFPTLHKLHRVNVHYSYDSLRTLIERIHPDIIAAEIRPEDITADSTYLQKNYPYEMCEMQAWFPGAAIRGIDWLGEDVEGKPIPADYWKSEAPIRQWEQALNQDTLFTKRLEGCAVYNQARRSLLQTLSLAQLLKSQDQAYVKLYYDCLEQQLRGSLHARILQFYDRRNEQLAKNALAIVAQNPDKTIVILTGDDHYGFLRHYLELRYVHLQAIPF